MAGVLGVASVGIAVRAGPAGGTVSARAELVCDDAEQCVAVEKLLLRKRLEWSKDLSLRLVGIGALVDACEITREEVRVHVTFSASATALAGTIDRVVRLRARSGGAPDAPRPMAADAGP
jgi:hypothetical protein